MKMVPMARMILRKVTFGTNWEKGISYVIG